MHLRLSAVCLVALLVCGVFSAAVHKRDVADESSSDKESRICYNNTPCGWMVYVPYTRRIDYFMKNSCECPSGKVCKYSNDDLSVSAYIHRCGEAESSSITTES